MDTEAQHALLRISAFLVVVLGALFGLIWLSGWLGQRERMRQELARRGFTLGKLRRRPEADWVMETQDYPLFMDATPYEVTYNDWEGQPHTERCWMTSSTIYWINELDVEMARHAALSERHWDYVTAVLLMASAIWLGVSGGMTLPGRHRRNLHFTGWALGLVILAALFAATSLFIKILARKNSGRRRRFWLAVGDITGKSAWGFMATSFCFADYQ